MHLNHLLLGAKTRATLVILGVVAGVTGAIATAEWSGIPGQSPKDGALYRLMQMPVHSVMGPRPPKESVIELSRLIGTAPADELYALRAMQEEAALDFAASEADWKQHAQLAKDKTKAQFELANFYHRRLRPADEVSALGVTAREPAPAREQFTPITDQNSWRAFERIETVLRENALAPALYDANFRQWIARYPNEKQVYARYLQFLLDQKQFPAAEKLVSDYRGKFPDDNVFLVKARALLAYRRSSTEQGLAVYDKEFQPLWPQELVQSYFDLLDQTHSTRKFLDQARGSLERDPNDLNAAARLFYYYQRQGRADAAQQTLIAFRVRKEQHNAKWATTDLYTIARLNELIKNYPEAARHYYALYSAADKDDTRAQALAGVIKILLDAPEQNVQLGSCNLAMYRDVATMDTGPGYLNGILSLVMNSTAPAYAYSEEEHNALPYFHQAEAAELLRLLDARYANSADRPALHAKLVQTFASYGQNDAVIRDGRQFLAAFPSAPEREDVALLLADAYARTHRAEEEFLLYDNLLTELAKKSNGIPLGLPEYAPNYSSSPQPPTGQVTTDTADENDNADGDDEAPAKQQNRAFAINPITGCARPSTRASSSATFRASSRWIRSPLRLWSSARNSTATPTTPVSTSGSRSFSTRTVSGNSRSRCIKKPFRNSMAPVGTTSSLASISVMIATLISIAFPSR
jgi:hypothetical protein